MGEVTPIKGKQTCDYCLGDHPWEHCDRIASIEYFETGKRYRVEFKQDPIIEFEFDDPEDE